ncbi:hypothetical protein LPN04_19525 [Rugamonas sp. A1-17]|nr:hypothetical protein [Rugamonas sp. A1-17]
MKTVYINVLLWLWSLVALCAAAAHIVMPAWTAAGTNWLGSAHWQREIGYFDIVLAGIFSWTARQPDLSIKRGAALVLCGLSLALMCGQAVRLVGYFYPSTLPPWLPLSVAGVVFVMALHQYLARGRRAAASVR